MSNVVEITKAVILVLKKDAKGELSKEKPSVPIYVNDWFARNAVGDRSTFELRLLELAQRESKVTIHLYGEKFYVWLLRESVDAIETLVKMYNNGYTLDEPKYTVKMKGLYDSRNYLNHKAIDDYWVFDSIEDSNLYKTQFTRKELEDAGFAEVFNSPLFEVEKVK